MRISSSRPAEPAPAPAPITVEAEEDWSLVASDYGGQHNTTRWQLTKTTVRLNEQKALLPSVSVAMYVMLYEPTTNTPGSIN